MACPVLVYPVCKLTGTVAGATGGAAARGAADSGLATVAEAISKAIAGLVRTMLTWWIGVGSTDVSKEPVIGHLRAWFLPIAIAVTIAGLIAAGTRMALARKVNPLIDVTGGLLVIAVTAAVGVLVPNALLKAGDAWSVWVLDQSIGDRFGTRMAGLLSLSGASSGFVVIVGVVVLVLCAVQAVLMLLRETAIAILIGMLPLAAAGAMSPGMRGWIKRVAAWLLALIFYKPAAAAVYATAFTLIGSGNSSIRDQLMGVCALILALVALPVLIKFFTFAVGSVGQHTGGGILGAATGAMVAAGSLRAGSGGGGGGGSAVSQAAYTSSRMPPPGTGSTAAGSTGSTGRGGFGSTPSGASAPGGDAPAPQPQTCSGNGDGGPGQRRSQAPAPAPGMATAGPAQPGTPASVAAPGPASGSAPSGTASAGTGAAGTAAAASAGGPTAAAAAATVEAGRKAADGARNAAGSAMTPDGSESQ